MQGRILSECLKAGECNARFQDLVSHEHCLQAANLFSAVVILCDVCPGFYFATIYCSNPPVHVSMCAHHAARGHVAHGIILFN